jgi:malonyl-CoA O-methyltransferase
MAEPSDLDRTAVRRQFDRRVETPGTTDFVAREVERRMLERLELVKLEPARVLDVGCGLGDGIRRLRGRWPRAEAIGVDLSPRRVARAAAIDRPGPAGWAQGFVRRLAGRAPAAPVGPLARYVVGDAHRLPVASDSIDLAWSNLAFHWFDDVPAAIAEWYRVLRPGGLLAFSAFGVDTLAELRAAGLPMPSLPDMHDIGDALVEAGFAEPVMDTERLTITWTDPRTMLAELRALGGDPRRSRRRGLATPRALERALAALQARLRGGDPSAPMELTFELVQGHAWIGERKRLRDGWAPLEFRPRDRPGARPSRP